MKDAVARAQNRATSESRATWRQPLMRVPGDVCDTLNKTFAAFAQEHGATQQQSAVLLSEVLSQPLTRLPSDVQERLNVSLVTYAEALGLSLPDAALHLCELLEQVPAQQWRHLHAAVTG